MKRSFVTAPFLSMLVSAVALLPASRILAQNPAADAAAQQEREERYQTLRARLDQCLEAQTLLQKRIAALADEVQSVRQDAERNGASFATHDEVRKLADTVREVDKRREDDRKLILEEIRKLASQPAPEPPVRKRETTKAPEPEPEPAAPQKGYEYEVKSGDTIHAIVAAYQANGVKVTVNQVLKANPGVNPNKLRRGQKVFIPDPNAK